MAGWQVRNLPYKRTAVGREKISPWMIVKKPAPQKIVASEKRS
jgi:hypothetical protein